MMDLANLTLLEAFSIGFLSCIVLMAIVIKILEVFEDYRENKIQRMRQIAREEVEKHND